MSSSPALRGSSLKLAQALARKGEEEAQVIIPCVAGQFFEVKGVCNVKRWESFGSSSPALRGSSLKAAADGRAKGCA